MNYIKRRYRDVKDSFEWEYSGKSFFIKWTTVGCNQLGIWLQPWSNDQPYGFFEWSWIKEVLISESDERIYFVMHDMEAVYENVILWIPKIAFKLNISDTSNGKAVTMMYREDVLGCVLYASEKGYAKVISIE